MIVFFRLCEFSYFLQFSLRSSILNISHLKDITSYFLTLLFTCGKLLKFLNYRKVSGELTAGVSLNYNEASTLGN